MTTCSAEQERCIAWRRQTSPGDAKGNQCLRVHTNPKQGEFDCENTDTLSLVVQFKRGGGIGCLGEGFKSLRHEGSIILVPAAMRVQGLQFRGYGV